MIRLLEFLSFCLAWSYTYIFFRILRCFLPLRGSRAVPVLAFLVCGYLADCIVYANDLAALLGPMLGFLIYVLVFYCGTLWEKGSLVLMLYPALVAVNYLMMDVGSRLFFSLEGTACEETSGDPRRLLVEMAVHTACLLLRLLFWLGVWLLLRGSLAKIRDGLTARAWGIVDVLMAASFVAIFTILYFMPEDTLIAYPICGASLCSSLGCIYLSAYICETARADHHARQMELQRDYYKGLLREEERVRSVYHDLKNHLLVLQAGAGSGQAAQALQTLQARLEGYETYCRTGNEYLDVLLRDKAAAAQEKGIDFQASVQAGDAGFLDPLDISTIFGNALDNAIEASAEMPAGERLITVKMDRIRDMLLILVENTAMACRGTTQGTTKKDPWLHGFGLPNIRQSVERYGGQCSTQAENGQFTLKILLPVP